MFAFWLTFSASLMWCWETSISNRSTRFSTEHLPARRGGTIPDTATTAGLTATAKMKSSHFAAKYKRQSLKNAHFCQFELWFCLSNRPKCPSVTKFAPSNFTRWRNQVETMFSQLTDQFLAISNCAKESSGLFARTAGKVSATTA